jgi:peptidoglycan biosynthesis protein MviN/MurJ (putative lipid II flippase)
VDVVVTIALSVALVGTLSVPALGLGLSIGTWAEAVWLLVALRRREPAFELAPIGGVIARSGLGAILAGGAGFAAVTVLALLAPGAAGKPFALLEAVVATIAGALVYLAFAAILRIPELTTILSTVGELARARRRPAG